MSDNRPITLEEKQKRIYEVFVLDESQSMLYVKDATLEGINNYIKQVKQDAKTTGLPTFVTLVLFNHKVRVAYVNKSIDEVVAFEDSEYQPNGNTALNDAMGVAITRLEKELGADCASDDVDVTFTGFTDGDENASTDYPGVGNANLAKLIKRVQDEYKWTVTYVGPGTQEQAVATAQNYGIAASNVMAYSVTSDGIGVAFDTMNTARSAKSRNFAKGVKMTADYFGAPDATLTTKKQNKPTDKS